MIITDDWEGRLGWGEAERRSDQGTHEWKQHTESFSYTQLELFQKEAWSKDECPDTMPSKLVISF